MSNPALTGIVNKILDVIVIPIIEGLFVFTVLVFIWGVVGLIRNADNADGRKTGQNHVIWGVVGMAIMFSAYGIIRLIGNTVGVGDPFR